MSFIKNLGKRQIFIPLKSKLISKEQAIWTTEQRILGRCEVGLPQVAWDELCSGWSPRPQTGERRAGMSCQVQSFHMDEMVPQSLTGTFWNVSWLSVSFQGKVRNHSPWRVYAAPSCQPLESRSGDASRWNCSFLPLPSLLCMQWSGAPQTQPWEASLVSSALPGKCERRLWLQWLRWGAIYRWIWEVGTGLPENQLCGLARLWALWNPQTLGRVFLPRSFIIIFIFPPIPLTFELVIYAYGNKNHHQKGLKGVKWKTSAPLSRTTTVGSFFCLSSCNPYTHKPRRPCTCRRVTREAYSTCAPLNQGWGLSGAQAV